MADARGLPPPVAPVGRAVNGYGVVNAVIYNPSSRQVTYTWVCTSFQ
jgi:hypothetical protein